MTITTTGKLYIISAQMTVNAAAVIAWVVLLATLVGA